MGYLHDNPVSVRLVERAIDYAWSSARFWETGTRPVACDGLAW